MNKSKHNRLLLNFINILTVILLSSQLFAEETKIYSYVDSKGMLIYTDVPPKNRPSTQHHSKLLPPPTLNKTVKIYQFVDSKGVIHLTDEPKGSDYKLLFVPAIHPKFQEYQSVIQEIANNTGVDAALLHAIIQVESAYNPTAVSPKGAVGLMQLMPETAKHYGVTDPTDATANVAGGAQHLLYLLTLFDNNIEFALAGYNAGENAVKRYGIPPYEETQNYVEKVMKLYSAYQDVIISIKRDN